MERWQRKPARGIALAPTRHMPSDLLKRLREIIDADPRTRSAGESIAVSVEDDGRVTLEGEVADVAAKRVATDRVSRLPDQVASSSRLLKGRTCMRGQVVR